MLGEIYDQMLSISRWTPIPMLLKQSYLKVINDPDEIWLNIELSKLQWFHKKKEKTATQKMGKQNSEQLVDRRIIDVVLPSFTSNTKRTK